MRHPEFKKLSAKREWIRLGIKLAVLLLIFWILLGVLFGIRRIEGVGMSPRVSDGDLSLFFRTSDGLEVGDVVLFSKDGKDYVSRIAAVENDLITLSEDGHLSINGEEYSDTLAYDLERGDEVKISYPQRVEKGKYFVINDNLDSSNDSREFGTIEKTNIYGKVISILRTRDI
jgi:signal peptidase I